MFVATVGDPEIQLSPALRRRRDEAVRSTQLSVVAAERRALEGFSEKEKAQSTSKGELATSLQPLAPSVSRKKGEGLHRKWGAQATSCSS